MRRSFRRQLTMIFSAVMAGTLLIIFLSGMVFLEKYYISDKLLLSMFLIMQVHIVLDFKF